MAYIGGNLGFSIIITFMLLVVFGAGASYDSVHHLPPPKPVTGMVVNNKPLIPLSEPGPHECHRPPLASQLFDTRASFADFMEEFGDMRAIVPLLRRNVPVEAQLASLEREAEHSVDRSRQLLAVRYYLQSALWDCQARWAAHHRGTNNYVTFIDAIEMWRSRVKEPICFVTFNYDTMLEQAMIQRFGYAFPDLDRYTLYDYKIIKLHGSIDWGLMLESPVFPKSARDVIAAVPDVRTFPDQYRKATSAGVILEDGNVGYPALAIPVEKKTNEFSCPSTHVEVLGNLIGNVTKIITIGWRATEERFLKMLNDRLIGLKNDVDLMIVSGDEKGANETLGNLRIGSPTTDRKRMRMPEGFTGLINNIGVLDHFL